MVQVTQVLHCPILQRKWWLDLIIFYDLRCIIRPESPHKICHASTITLKKSEPCCDGRGNRAPCRSIAFPGDKSPATGHHPHHYNLLEELTAQIKKTQRELEAATSEMAKQLFEHQHDLKIKLADQERETEQAFVTEANEKLVFWCQFLPKGMQKLFMLP